MLSIEPHQDPASFWAASQHLLLTQESRHNLIIGRTLGFLSGERPWDDSVLLTVRDGEQVVGAAMQGSFDDTLLLSSMPQTAARPLVEFVWQGPKPPRQVATQDDLAPAFIEAWTSITGRPTQLRMRQAVYELTRVALPDPAGGRLVCAQSAQAAVARTMMRGFIHDAFPDNPSSGRGLVNRLLPRGYIFLWATAEGQLVSMVSRNRETPTTATISHVYTPPSQRGRGYASRAVASLSQLLLDRGKRACNLYADLENPTSNAIYCRIGYVQIAEGRVVDL